MSKRKLVRLTALLFGVSLLLGACSGNGLSSELEIIRAELKFCGRSWPEPRNALPKHRRKTARWTTA